MARSKGTPNAGPRGIEEIGERDGWRCWLCDEAVDHDRSVNDDLGPSVDSRITKSKAKSKSKQRAAGPVQERLAHRMCNTGKGAVAPAIEWPERFFVADPAAIIGSVERLERKGGREAMGRCLTQADAEAAGAWLVDRISRLEPTLDCATSIEAGGGQFLVILSA